MRGIYWLADWFVQENPDTCISQLPTLRMKSHAAVVEDEIAIFNSRICQKW
jgi:hypothetical protein